MSEEVLYDFIICGGGTAGCVMAERLSGNGLFQVRILDQVQSHVYIQRPGFYNLFQPVDLIQQSQMLLNRCCCWKQERQIALLIFKCQVRALIFTIATLIGNTQQNLS